MRASAGVADEGANCLPRVALRASESLLLTFFNVQPIACDALIHRTGPLRRAGDQFLLNASPTAR